MHICHLHKFSGEVSVKIFGWIFNHKVCCVITGFLRFSVCFGFSVSYRWVFRVLCIIIHKSYVFYKLNNKVRGLSSHFLDFVVCKVEVFHFHEVFLINYFFPGTLGFYLKSHLPYPCLKDFLLMFPTRSFIDLNLHLGLWPILKKKELEV